MSAQGMHHDWLSLIEISGPFLAVPVLKEAFPQGLEELDGVKRKRLRQAYEEWRDALETDDPQLPELHAAWVDEVLSRGLELDEDGRAGVLKRADWCTANLSVSLSEHAVTLAPDLAVVDEQRANKPLMLIHAYAQDTDLDATQRLDGWAATSAERMVQLCRATGCRLGLVTNGERWMLIDAPVGAVTTFASWYARIWAQEPITLQAFVHLLGIRRFFVDEAEQLPALLDRSLKYQDEVTEALGEQVRRAVEVLIQALDKADQDRDRELLRNVKEPELYEAALTLMMRLVFLLAAEERGLLLLGDERYESNYAISTLRMQLRTESEEILERRWDAWSRLLATFRAVFGGIEHENLRLPALGGSLFDPDRFPFLEGRAKGSNWRTEPARPLPIDNRTVLLLLDAIQQFQGRTLSYRALDVEQVGYVYEGLLERTVKRTAEVTLELDGTKNAKAPWIKLVELESAGVSGAAQLAELLQDRSGSSASRIRNDLAKPVDDTLADRLLAACHGDSGLRDRIKRFAHLVRSDPWGYPLVYPAGAFIVTTGSDRRETGTHYTPKSLTETIVVETLTPVVYVGPSEGRPRDQWVLKSSSQILDLKICDPAMGSGAFLVQACRWLAERLVEAWSLAERSGGVVTVDGAVLDAANGKELLPRDVEARALIARRLIAERCLYGVDLNPLAVELAKLSIWLVTLAKGRPFGFLDHNLRCGDSLLGIHRLDQLTELVMTPTSNGQQRLFGQNIERGVHEAIELRQRLREMPIRDIRDVEAMAAIDTVTRQKLELAEHIADALVGEVYKVGGGELAQGAALMSLALQVEQIICGDSALLLNLTERAKMNLSSDLPDGKRSRQPFHWPLQFPEVFQRKDGGFSAIVTNPPFAEGGAIAPLLLRYFRTSYGIATSDEAGMPSGSAKTNLLTIFIERNIELTQKEGRIGFVAPKPLLRNERYWRARKYIIDNSALTHVFNLPNDLFRSANVETCAVILLKSSRADRSIKFAIVNTKFPIESFESDLRLAKADKYFVIRIEASATADELLKAIEGSSTRLGDYFQSRVGIGTGRKDFRAYILGTKRGAQFVPHVYSTNFGKVDHHLGLPEDFNEITHKPIIKGRDFTAFSSIKWEGDYVRYADRYAYIEEFFVNGTKWSAQLREKSHYDRSIKVVSRQTANTLMATVDLGRHFPLDSVHVHFPNDDIEQHGYNCYVLCALLNSKILRYYYRTKSEEVGSLFPQVHLSKVRELPIPRKIEKKIADELTFLAKRAIESAGTPDLIGEIDSLAYQAYGVSQSVIDAIESGATPAQSSEQNFGSTIELEQPLVSAGEIAVEISAKPSQLTAAGTLGEIVDFLRSNPGWHSKSEVLSATGLSDGQWIKSVNALIDSGEIERQGEKRGTRYRALDTWGGK